MYMPLDVLNKKFKKGFAGYSTEEVDEFKEEIASDYEKLYKENIELKDKLDIVNKALQHYKSMEIALQNTLLIAQKTSEDIKNAAYQRADVIKKEGTVEAEIIISNAKHEVEKLKQEYTFLKREYENFRVKFKAMLSSEMQLLDESLDISNDIRCGQYCHKKAEEDDVREYVKEENVIESSALEEKDEDVELEEVADSNQVQDQETNEDDTENLKLQET